MEAPLEQARMTQLPECAVAGGCSYLRALSTIEHIAGFERTALSYANAAAECSRHGCRAANVEGGAPGLGEHGCPSAGTGQGGPAPMIGTPPEPILFKDVLRDVRITRGSRETRPPAGGGETIAFSRSSHVDIIADRDGNYVERRLLKLETLPQRADPLGYLYRYWRDLQTLTPCRFSDIDTVHLTRVDIIGKLHVVDVSSSDPGDFRFELAGYAIPLGRFEKPRALPVPIYADATMRDYNTVRLTAAPRLHRMRCRLGDTVHHYTRLILPFLGANGRVNRLLVAIREEPGNGIKVEAGD